MKKSNKFIFQVFVRTFIILSLLTFASVNINAQSKIYGKILDKETGEPLVGVTVFIKGTSLGTSSDLDGKYELILSPGIYNLSFKYISYKDWLINGISLQKNEANLQNVILEEASANGKSLGEAEIKGIANKESVASIFIAQKNAITVSDGLSSEQFRKTPDKNVSDILKRVSGTSIQENKFAIIRGMNDRYNAAYLNGAPLPSTESDRKAFAFNIIPATLIDNLIIYKAPSPELIGDFAGGVIMINTKSIPETKTSQLNFSIGSHTLTTFQSSSHFRTSKTDILGFDNGTRAIPESKYYREGSSKNEYINFTKKFNNDWNIYQTKAMPNTNLSYSWGRSFKHHKNSFGTMASFAYSNSNKTNLVQQKKFRYEDNNLDQNFIDQQYIKNVNFGALLNLAYKFNKKHIITIKNLFNINSDDITTLRSGLSSGENLYYSNSFSNIYSQNRILTTQITGEHFISTKKHRINWVLNAGNIYKLMPDYRIVTYVGEGENSENYTLALNNNQFTSSSGRFFSNMSETIFSGTANYSLPFKWRFTKNDFKLGLFSQLRKRDFSSRYFTYYGPWGITGTPDKNLGAGNINEQGVYMVEQSSPARDNYNAVSNLNAGYMMMDSRFWVKYRLVYGIRYEFYHQKINTANETNLPLVIDSTYNNILPSANLTCNLSEKVNLRLSAGKTLNRPEYRELASFPFFNFNLNSNIAGSPKLQPASIWNYDVRWEFFPKANEVISIGAFYKKISNPIEMAIDVTQVSIRTYGYTNQKSANNYGIEMDFRKSFDFLSKTTGIKGFENLTFFANLSLIKSKIIFNSLSTALTDRPLQGQSPYVLNTGFQFKEPKSGWGINLSYNKIGRRIAFVGAPKLARFGLDIYENPRTVIDIQLSKSNKNWDYKLTVGDLLAQNLIFYQDINQDKKFNAFEDNTIYNYNNGQSITAAISYKFK